VLKIRLILVINSSWRRIFSRKFILCTCKQ